MWLPTSMSVERTRYSEKGSVSSEEGQLWVATIPGTAISQAGHILRWAAVATDAAGNKWRTPSFCDPDNAYEWYGTLIEPPEGLLSEKLQTFHIFAGFHWDF